MTDNQKKSYTFVLEKNIHMYNHWLTYTDSYGSVGVELEDSIPYEGILVWEKDFSKDKKRRELISKRFQVWANERDIALIIDTKYNRIR